MDAAAEKKADVPYIFQQLFPDDMETFLRHKASSINSSIGYIVPALLSTTALSAKNGCRVATATHEQPMNIYTIFVGYPGTGKSSAIQHGCLGPLASLLDNELSSFILDRHNSSSLVKHISTKQSTFIVSPEIYDVLNKLLKNDEDNASGDASYYVHFFPAKRVLTHTPQKATEIFQPTLLSLSSAARKCQMQPSNLQLIARMDQGQGLIDRFLLAVPNALCSTSDEVENAREHLSTEPEE
ncbi:Hypothetical predicted protein [Paramuricea clavata]|uniref:Uncharacterized protein n=1 Tax=Paramuricea clavata TaxID=317549 RepID=A0A7D9E9Y8_PARCT|nr:Hypothetical predicted protein [Paramuricea clavata]